MTYKRNFPIFFLSESSNVLSNYATVESKTKDIMGAAVNFPDLFPKSSTAGKTKAKAEIWEKGDEFNQAGRILLKAATELAAAANSKDDAAVGVKVKGLSQACSGCHKLFRAEKYSGE